MRAHDAEQGHGAGPREGSGEAGGDVAARTRQAGGDAVHSDPFVEHRADGAVRALGEQARRIQVGNRPDGDRHRRDRIGEQVAQQQLTSGELIRARQQAHTGDHSDLAVVSGVPLREPSAAIPQRIGLRLALRRAPVLAPKKCLIRRG
ncbi:hypothetical protein PWJ90_34095 [Nocardia gipuzkoensis]|nr:hypothetical protein [Nocardia gipuzkoensis]MDE1674650.1 hypothetical protein [Nocardia gipuzkoensis]